MLEVFRTPCASLSEFLYMPQSGAIRCPLESSLVRRVPARSLLLQGKARCRPLLWSPDRLEAWARELEPTIVFLPPTSTPALPELQVGYSEATQAARYSLLSCTIWTREFSRRRRLRCELAACVGNITIMSHLRFVGTSDPLLSGTRKWWSDPCLLEPMGRPGTSTKLVRDRRGIGGPRGGGG